MRTNCYQIAFEQATSEIAAIDAEIRKLTRRKELLEKLLEPLKLLVPEFGSFATHVTVLDNNLPYSEVATQVSPVVLMKVSEPEGVPIEAPVWVAQPGTEEMDLHARRNRRSVSHEDVAGLAYRFWNERGQVHGHHEADWLRAAHELEYSPC